MTRFRTTEEIRRYDLMKLGVLVLLILLLILTWLATRDDGALDLMTTAEPTAVVEGGLTREPGVMPAPTLVPPVIDTPVGRLSPGAVTQSGRAGPGAQVAVQADGRPLGLATTGVDGAWALTTDLPAGPHSLVAQTIDNVGTIVAESAPLTITVGDAALGETAGQAQPPTFQPLTDTWALSGTAAPGAAVVILANGVPVAETTADATGAWTLAVPGANVAGDVIVQSTDATGATVSTPLSIGARPPSVAAPGQTAAPADNAVLVVPVGPGVWMGQAAPGTQVEAIVDDQSAGATSTDAQGNWSLSLNLPAGPHTLRFNSLDPAGVLLAAGATLPVAAGEDAAGEAAAGADASPVPEGATPEATPEAPTADTVAAVLRARPEFATLVRAIDVAGLGDALAQPGPFTVFAPTEDAFKALPQSVVDALLANPEALATVLRYHVARGRYTADELRTVQPSTIDGRLLTITSQADGQTVNGALMSTTDIAAGNGIIHAVDRILLPPLAAGVRPPVIDESGVPTFVGPSLTVVGSAEPGRSIRVELNGEAFGDAAIVDANGRWQVSGDVSAADYRIVAFMLNGATLEAFSQPVALTVR